MMANERRQVFQQTRDVHPMLIYNLSSIADGEPTLVQCIVVNGMRDIEDGRLGSERWGFVVSESTRTRWDCQQKTGFMA